MKVIPIKAGARDRAMRLVNHFFETGDRLGNEDKTLLVELIERELKSYELQVRYEYGFE